MIEAHELLRSLLEDASATLNYSECQSRAAGQGWEAEKGSTNPQGRAMIDSIVAGEMRSAVDAMASLYSEAPSDIDPEILILDAVGKLIRARVTRRMCGTENIQLSDRWDFANELCARVLHDATDLAALYGVDGAAFTRELRLQTAESLADAEAAVRHLRTVVELEEAKAAEIMLAGASNPNAPTLAELTAVLAKLEATLASRMPKTRRGLARLAATTSKDLGVIADLNSGLSYRDAAKRNNVSKTTVERIAKANDLTGHAPDAVPLERTLDENLTIRGKARKHEAK